MKLRGYCWQADDWGLVLLAEDVVGWVEEPNPTPAWVKIRASHPISN
jgi:hypothetical protein